MHVLPIDYQSKLRRFPSNSQFFTAVVWHSLFWLFKTCSFQFWNLYGRSKKFRNYRSCDQLLQKLYSLCWFKSLYQGNKCKHYTWISQGRRALGVTVLPRNTETSPPWTNELGQPLATRIFRLTAPDWKMISPVLFAWNFLMTFKVGIENIEANIEASWKVDIVTSYTPQQQGHSKNYSAGNENVAKQRV